MHALRVEIPVKATLMNIKTKQKKPRNVSIPAANCLIGHYSRGLASLGAWL